jgi:hypothetical protein
MLRRKKIKKKKSKNAGEASKLQKGKKNIFADVFIIFFSSTFDGLLAGVRLVSLFLIFVRIFFPTMSSHQSTPGIVVLIECATSFFSSSSFCSLLHTKEKVFPSRVHRVPKREKRKIRRRIKVQDT